MPLLLWDASGLAKRYSLEIGSETVDALFDAVAASDMTATFLGYVETLATLVHKHNQGSLTHATFVSAASLLQAEVLDSSEFGLLEIDNAAILGGIEFVLKHSLNASDAAILATYLRYAQLQPVGAPACLLITADRRLLRAANAEGLQAINPELLAASDVSTFLARLP